MQMTDSVRLSGTDQTPRWPGPGGTRRPALLLGGDGDTVSGDRGKRKKDLYYDEAERLYVSAGLPVPRIFDVLRRAVSMTTLYKWRRDGGWQQQRQDYRSTADKAVASLRAKIINISAKLDRAGRDEDVARIADTLSKLDKVLDRFDRKRDVYGETIRVLDSLVEWMRQRDDREGLEALESRIGDYAQHVATTAAV